ncbi:phosphoesterase [Segetibacter aerophilus]|uniref:Phosphoesterase n=2 Tax=Segetibacter aerophilus TaxID=670293 RepID=A0A512B9F1_9BACT|nr:phosphoesterase [Segetibacter aerophilus]
MLDLYVFQVLKALASGASEKTRLVIYVVYWALSVSSIAFLLLLPYLNTESWPKNVRNYLFATIAGLFIAKLLATIFFLIDDIRRGITWVLSKMFPENIDSTNNNAAWNMSRSAFLSWLGVGVGGTFLTSFIYGFSNKYNYDIQRVKLSYNNLPAGFKGLKIVQISDVHSGSFANKAAVSRGIDMILKENADIILFTGDLVNDVSTEMHNYIDVFNRLKAPLGVYSTLGNHDYGDYVEWPSLQAKKENLEKLKGIHRQMGWRLLMNEHVALERNGDSIALLGIENWSALKRFPKHGKMELAHAGTEKYPFKILMSHDPTHWDAEVRPKYGDIDLALAGHTHGMQFGLETPFFKWSPVQWVYRQWAGLYEEGNQKLYVNRGYGFLGYPGRVGIMPEITVIELV